MQAEVSFDRDLVRRYDVTGPRYTSYPTVPQFGEFDEVAFRQAVAASPYRDRDLSLYVHLPFCATLCYYCACNKIVTRNRDLAVQYLDMLGRELDIVAPLFAGRTVSQLHWGGGTPTFLDDQQVTFLMQVIREHFLLRSDVVGEYSIEVDPRTVDEDRVLHLRSVGFNRMSLGIQDFNPRVQKAVNRKQSFADTKSVIDAARLSGFRSVSVDLIYGLPFQTRESFDETLLQILELRPDRISIYNYAHLPDRFPPQKRIIGSDLPEPLEKLAILELCVSRLTDGGYVYIGMDHFALPEDDLNLALQDGTLQRNFQGYSTHADSDMLAIGVTSISHIGNTFSQNARELEDWESLVAKGQLPVVKGMVIDAEDQLRAKVIHDLTCRYAIRFSDYEVNFRQHFAAEIVLLDCPQRDGLVHIDEEGIRVSERGRPLVRNICMIFDRYFESGAGKGRQFSRVI